MRREIYKSYYERRGSDDGASSRIFKKRKGKIMLGQKLLDNSTVRLDDVAHQQYVVVNEEIKKLCDLSHMGWDLTGHDLFETVRKVSFVEGAVFGAALLGLVISIRKIGKTKPTSNEG